MCPSLHCRITPTPVVQSGEQAIGRLVARSAVHSALRHGAALASRVA